MVPNSLWGLEATAQVVYAINIANLILGFVAFGLLFNRTFRRRAEYPREVHLLLITLEGFVLVLLIASVEMMTLAGSDRWLHIALVSAAITTVKSCLLWTLWRTRDVLYRTGTRHIFGQGRNADELNVDRDFPDHPREGDYVAERE